VSALLVLIVTFQVLANCCYKKYNA
jgi:hypothetical protein